MQPLLAAVLRQALDNHWCSLTDQYIISELSRIGKGEASSSSMDEVGTRGIAKLAPPSAQTNISTSVSSESSDAGGEDLAFIPATTTGRSCARCLSHETPQWRYIQRYRFCNACYMKVKRWFDSNQPGMKLPGRTRNPNVIDEECDRILYKAFEA